MVSRAAGISTAKHTSAKYLRRLEELSRLLREGESQTVFMLLFARSLGHRFGAGAAPFGSAFRTRVPRPPGFGLLPPRRLRVPFQKLLLLGNAAMPRLGSSHLRALWDVSRLTGQKGETPCRHNRSLLLRHRQQLSHQPHYQDRTQIHRLRSRHHLRPQPPGLSLQRRRLRETGPLR